LILNKNHIFVSALDVVGKIWALPNTVIGLVYGALGHVTGKVANRNHESHISFGNNAIQFENSPLVTTAITLGNVIIYGKGARFQPGALRCGGAHTLGTEEMQHTFQAQILGPLYLPAHGLLGTAAKLLNGNWHGPLNVLEAGPHDEEPTAWKSTCSIGWNRCSLAKWTWPLPKPRSAGLSSRSPPA
jgi:hypothetical protein